MYDLRFVSGPAGAQPPPFAVPDPVHQWFALPGVYQIDLWARVEGTNGNIIDEGLTTSAISLSATK
jgi:hypothetical protein